MTAILAYPRGQRENTGPDVQCYVALPALINRDPGPTSPPQSRPAHPALMKKLVNIAGQQ
jgi:hypothetical protein